MVISTNNVPPKSEFEKLLRDTINSLKIDSQKRAKYYLSLGGHKLESTVADILIDNSKNTAFENSIELVSGQKFPDIVAKKFYGVEVKTTKTNHWKSTGSSIAEGTRVEGVERIFMLFGKLCNPIDFKCKPYEDCLSEVVVTHSPRYLIDMNIEKGETIFDKIKVPYDKLRKQENPIKTILQYYRKQLKPGEEIWWLGQENIQAPGLIIRLWNNLSADEQESYRLKAFCYFPELLSNKTDKFNRCAIWLSTQEGVVCPNVRDIFTAGGQGILNINSKKYKDVPRIILKLTKKAREIQKLIIATDSSLLSEYWGINVSKSNKYDIWRKLIVKNSKSIFKSSIPIINILLSYPFVEKEK